MTTVLYVMCSQNYSGAEIVIERLVLANRDRVRPLLLCPPGAYADRLRARGVTVIEERALASLNRGERRYTRLGLAIRVALKLLGITRHLLRIIRDEQPTVVHANNLAAAVYSLPACLAAPLLGCRARWIWSNHDLTYPHGRLSVWLARVCHRCYERTIAVSNAVRERYGRYAARIEVLYNGLDPYELAFDPEARSRFRQQWKLDRDTVAIGIVGMIEEGKGHHLLVQAVGRIAPKWPAVRLLIVGPFGRSDPAYESRLRAVVKQYGRGCVQFTGPVDLIKDVYSGLDIVVNATTSRRQEPLGTTIYEAMACERVVVATRTGGSAEIIDDGVDGFLCAPDSVDALAERLEHVLSHFHGLGEVRAAARQKVMARFSIGRMCKEYNDLLIRLGALPVQPGPGRIANAGKGSLEIVEGN